MTAEIPLGDVSESDLRACLELLFLALNREDQLRVGNLVEAFGRGVQVDIATMKQLSPSELRQWADRLGESKD